jgi:hypothetical protein
VLCLLYCGSCRNLRSTSPTSECSRCSNTDTSSVIKTPFRKCVGRRIVTMHNPLLCIL